MSTGSSLLLATVVAALAGAAAGALAGSLLAPSASPRSVDDASVRAAAPPASANAAEYSGTNDDLVLEVGILRSENQELRRRLDALERELSASGSRVPVATDPASTPEVLGSDDPRFLANVNDALGEIRSEEERQALERWQALQNEKIESRLNRVAEDIGLSAYQIEEMRKLLLERERKRQEISQLGKEHGNKQQTRASLRLLRETSDAHLATILTPEQLKAYLSIEGGRDEKRYGGEERESADENSKGRRNRES